MLILCWSPATEQKGMCFVGGIVGVTLRKQPGLPKAVHLSHTLHGALIVKGDL